MDSRRHRYSRNPRRCRRARSRNPALPLICGLAALIIIGGIGWIILSLPGVFSSRPDSIPAGTPNRGDAELARPSQPTETPPESGDHPVSARCSVPAVPANRAAVTGWQDNATARHLTCPIPADIRTGSFDIASRMPTLPSLQCDYRIPFGDDGRPQPTAADIVLLFPYPTEKAAILGNAKALTERHGFTTVSLRFPGMGPQDGIRIEDRSRWYYWPESGAGEAWMEAVRRVRRLGGFPDRPVFVTGLSGGGAAAGLFADAHPESVTAVANMAGRFFADEARFRGPVLLTHGAHDYVLPPILAYEARVRAAGVPITRRSYPPHWEGRGTSRLWQHQFRGVAEQAFYRWLVTVADLRLADGGRMPDPAAWPVCDEGVNYPSAEVRDLFRRVTPAVRSADTGRGTVLIARTAPAIPPRGMIVIASGGFAADAEELSLDAEFFADHGFLSVVVIADDGPTAAVRSAMLRPELTSGPALPWFLVIDHPEDLSALRFRGVPPPAGMALCAMRPEAVDDALGALADAQASLLAIGSEAQLAPCRTGPTPKRLRLMEIRYANGAMWHAQRCRAVLSHIEGLTASK